MTLSQSSSRQSSFTKAARIVSESPPRPTQPTQEGRLLSSNNIIPILSQTPTFSYGLSNSANWNRASGEGGRIMIDTVTTVPPSQPPGLACCCTENSKWGELKEINSPSFFQAGLVLHSRLACSGRIRSWMTDVFLVTDLF